MRCRLVESVNTDARNVKENIRQQKPIFGQICGFHKSAYHWETKLVTTKFSVKAHLKILTEIELKIRHCTVNDAKAGSL